MEGIKRVADHLPFLTLRYRKQCTALLKKRLSALNLLDSGGRISPVRFLEFSRVKPGDTILMSGRVYCLYPVSDAPWENRTIEQ
jgi:hypothetical protein